MGSASGVTERRGAVGIGLPVEEADEFVTIVRFVFGSALEERADGGHVVAEGAVVEGGEAGVVDDGVVGRIVV